MQSCRRKNEYTDKWSDYWVEDMSHDFAEEFSQPNIASYTNTE
jgi:hypothetical protein